MNTRVYLNEWFINAGIIGFLRILKHNEQDFVIIKDNYIEFDTNNIKDFNKYYFKYFFDKYNIAQKMENRIEKSFDKIELLLQNKEQKDALKQEKKSIKEILKKQLDKIKKIDENTYKEMLEEYSRIDKVSTSEELKQIKDNLIHNFKKEYINKKITLNLFKSILNKNYFGQQSFLNVVKNSLSYEEQENIMYKDYISNIIETETLQEIASGNYTIEGLKEKLEQKQLDENIPKNMKKVYDSINKNFVKKNKTINEISNYINNKVFKLCAMCGNEHCTTSDYTEGNFIPLAVSSENMTNFFWEQNINIQICDICKLILFCIPAGVTNIIKTAKENGKYIEKDILSFVNYDTSVQNLLKTNNSFGIESKKERTQYNPYADLILDIVNQNTKVSDWQLKSIFVVEFETEYLAFSRMEYFNIKSYVAKFFTKYPEMLKNIKDYKYRIQVVDYLLKDKDIDKLVNQRLRDAISNKNNTIDSYLATKVKVTLQVLKKGEGLMNDEVKNANKQIGLMYAIGQEIKETLRSQNNENKLDGYIYKMLNCIKTNNRNEFTDVAIRILWSMGKDVPQILVKNNENVEWQELGHSFIAGLSSNKINNKGDKDNG